MKKTIFTLAFIAFAITVLGQQGSWYLGGAVGYSSQTDKDADDSDNKTITSSWTFNPEFGTFLSDRFQLGITLGVGGSSRKVGDNKDYSRSNFSPTVYVRHFYPITEKFSAYGGVYLGLVTGSQKNYEYEDGNETEYKTSMSGFNGRVGTGISYAIAPRFTIMGEYGLLSFSSVGYKNNDGDKTHTESDFGFGVNTLGTVFNVGIYYTIVQ
jgi:outer membrane protein